MSKKIIIATIISVLFIGLKNVIISSSGYKELELTYKTYGGVPYKWEYLIEDESIVGFVKTKDITTEEDKKLDGGTIYTNYIFKGLKQGTTTIIFKYINITNGTVEKEDRLTVKVDKYKNISLNLNS